MNNDFAQAIAAKSDQINNADLVGISMTITITKVSIRNGDDQPVTMSIKESEKFYRPCKGMSRVIATLWGGDPSKFIGRSLTLYRDPDVTFGKDPTGGTRISHASHIDGVQKVTVPVSRNKVKTYTIHPLQITPPAPQITEAEAQAAARAAAAQGRKKFTDWWNSKEGVPCRDLVKPIMADLQKAVADAEAPPEDAEILPPETAEPKTPPTDEEPI